MITNTNQRHNYTPCCIVNATRQVRIWVRYAPKGVHYGLRFIGIALHFVLFQPVFGAPDGAQWGRPHITFQWEVMLGGVHQDIQASMTPTLYCVRPLLVFVRPFFLVEV